MLAPDWSQGCAPLPKNAVRAAVVEAFQRRWRRGERDEAFEHYEAAISFVGAAVERGSSVAQSVGAER